MLLFSKLQGLLPVQTEVMLLCQCEGLLSPKALNPGKATRTELLLLPQDPKADLLMSHAPKA